MGSLRRQYGFWGSVGRTELRDLLGPEVIIGTIVGAGSALALGAWATASERASVAGDFVAIAAALAGIVFAGFALVIALMSDEYLALLVSGGEEGVRRFLAPFVVSTGLQIGAVLAAVAYRAAADLVPSALEPWLFGISSTLFVVAALDLVALARSVLMHGIARAKLLSVTIADDVQRLDDKRSSARG